jgi:hypothetical protein
MLLARDIAISIMLCILGGELLTSDLLNAIKDDIELIDTTGNAIFTEVFFSPVPAPGWYRHGNVFKFSLYRMMRQNSRWHSAITLSVSKSPLGRAEITSSR